MMSNRLAELEDRLANAAEDDLAGVASDGLVAAWPTAEPMPDFDPDLTESFDKAFTLIRQTLPNWSVVLQGAGATVRGEWVCTLRDSGLRDDVELIGVGRAATAPLAMILALLQVLISRSKGYD